MLRVSSDQYSVYRNGDIYCYETGLPISMSKDMYQITINIAILSKTVNVHCNYLKQCLNLMQLYTFISHFCSFHCFDENCHILFW